MTATYIVRPLFDLESSTWTYILTDKATKKAVIIDPVLDQVERDQKLLKEMGVDLVYIIETHIHADHITGASISVLPNVSVSPSSTKMIGPSTSFGSP